jgi:hypothetical protein
MGVDVHFWCTGFRARKGKAVGWHDGTELGLVDVICDRNWDGVGQDSLFLVVFSHEHTLLILRCYGSWLVSPEQSRRK